MNYLLYSEIHSLHYRSGHSSLIMLSPETFKSRFLHFMFPPFCPFFDEFNEKIHRMVSSGLVRQWELDEIDPRRYKKSYEEIGPQVLTMEHIAVGFMICMVPLGLSIITFIFELLHFKFIFTKKKKSRRSTRKIAPIEVEQAEPEPDYDFKLKTFCIICHQKVCEIDLTTNRWTCDDCEEGKSFQKQSKKISDEILDYESPLRMSLNSSTNSTFAATSDNIELQEMDNVFFTRSNHIKEIEDEHKSLDNIIKSFQCDVDIESGDGWEDDFFGETVKSQKKVDKNDIFQMISDEIVQLEGKLNYHEQQQRVEAWSMNFDDFGVVDNSGTFDEYDMDQQIRMFYNIPISEMMEIEAEHEQLNRMISMIEEED
jgi:hypothetical protein